MISIAICTHNEKDYLEDLLPHLETCVRESDEKWEVVLVDDNSNEETLSVLLNFVSHNNDFASIYKHSLDNNFATHKNFMNSACVGDWIFNLDADEWITSEFFHVLPKLIQDNSEVDVMYIPRVNIVEGLTFGHVRDWGWVVTRLEQFKKLSQRNTMDPKFLTFLKQFDLIINESGNLITHYDPIIQWPDYQMRLYKNKSQIHWINSVHEVLTGFESYVLLPPHPDWAIRHIKDIDRQEQQNKLYSSMSSR